MKKLLFFVGSLLVGVMAWGQAPQAFKYQAVARNLAGEVLINKAVSFRISVLQGSATGTAVYIETHTGKATNGFGLVDLEIGKGIVTTGSFAGIAWESHTHFLKVEMDPAGGTAYQVMGTTPLLSVPYALHAKTVEVDAVDDADHDLTNEIQTLSISGTVLTLSKGGGSVPLPSSGGGDNWGTQSVVTDASLVGLGTTTQPLRLAQQGATSGQVLKWNGTNWRAADDLTGSADWLKSGDDLYFNTGKVAIGKIPGSDLRQFQVKTEELQAIAGVNNSASYATIFGQNLGTGPAADFRNKIRIVDGTEGAGKVLTSDANGYTSWHPVTISSDAANFSGDGSAAAPLRLHAMGASAGQVLKWDGTKWDNANDDPGPWSSNDDNVYNSSGKKFGMGINNPSRKLTIAEATSTAYMNIVNSSTGYTATDGILMGMEGLNGWLTTYEAGNLYLGTNGMSRMTIASDGDVGIGLSSPSYKLDVNGSVNIRGNASDQALFCSNAEAIWYNDTYFSWGYGGQYNYFADEVSIGTSAVPGYNLVVNGTAAKTGGGSWSTLSDLRLKDLKGDYQKGLEEIIRLRPVKFTYKPGNPRGLDAGEEQIGFVAQEVQQVFPEAVSLCKDGYLDFNMHTINVALVNAVKALKAENDLLKQQNASLAAEQSNLKALLERQMVDIISGQSALKSQLDRQQKEYVAERDALKSRLEKMESLLQVNASAEGK